MGLSRAVATLAFERWDAFAPGRSPGNPVAVVRVNPGQAVDPALFTRLAGEMRGFVNVVTAVTACASGGHRLRFFTAATEAAFSGSGAHAAAASLLADGEAADLWVGDARLAARQQGPDILATAPPVTDLTLPDFLDDLFWALSLREPVRGREEEAAFLELGVRVLLIPMRTTASLADLVPTWEALTYYCQRQRVDMVVPYTGNPQLPASRWRLRAFAPRLGLRELPSSGTAAAALGARMLGLGRWRGEAAQVEQGASYERVGIVQLRAEETDGKPRVWFGGPAALRLCGTYYL